MGGDCVSGHQPAPNLVFPPEWVESKRKRYDAHPRYARPRYYNLWTTDHCQYIRDRIDCLVRLLGPEQQKEAISRLRDDKLFRQAYNELAVGDSLRAPNRELQYEPELDGLTP